MNKKKKLGCIIFARYDSKRLKGKVLKNVCNKPLLEIIYLRLTKVFSKDNIVIATSKDKEDKNIVEFCLKNKINYFCGSKKDLIKRSIECCKMYNFSGFARVCGIPVGIVANNGLQTICQVHREILEILLLTH